MIILVHRTTGERISWPEGKSYSGREWQAVGSDMTRELDELEKEFAAEGILLGDAIAKATTSMGFTPCPSCKRRQEWLNEWHKRGKEFVKEIVSQIKGEPHGIE